MYIIAGSTGTLGTAIVNALGKDNELFLIGRDEDKLREQASAINANYQAKTSTSNQLHFYALFEIYAHLSILL